MAVIGNQVIYIAPSDVEQARPVVIRCTAIVRGQGIAAREGVLSTEARETFDVVSIINDVIAICPGAEEQFTATLVGDRTVASYEWFPGEEGSIKGSNTEQTVTYVAPTDFDFCVFGSIRVKITFDDGEVLEDTETFLIPPSLLSINDWNNLNVIPDNKPVGLNALLLGIEEIEQTPEDEVQYTWSATSGSFSGIGDRVKFTHPTVSEDTLVTITCMVSTAKYECGTSRIDYLVVHGVELPLQVKVTDPPQIPVIRKGPTNELNPIPPVPPLPPVAALPEPPKCPIKPIPPDPTGHPPVNPIPPDPTGHPPVERLPELVPLKLPSELCFAFADDRVQSGLPMLVSEEYGIIASYPNDGDWDQASSPYFSASAVGSFAGSRFTAPETPELGVQLHCNILFEGKEQRVILNREYAEGTLTRDVVVGNDNISAPTTRLSARKAVDGKVQPDQFDPSSDTLDECESLFIESLTEGGNYDEIDTEFEQLTSAVAPTITLTGIGQVRAGSNERLTAVPTGGAYDVITYDWRIIPPSGAGTLGAGGVGPTRNYIAPPSVSGPTAVTILCIATVSGNGNNAQAGTSATALVVQETFEVVPR